MWTSKVTGVEIRDGGREVVNTNRHKVKVWLVTGRIAREFMGGKEIVGRVVKWTLGGRELLPAPAGELVYVVLPGGTPQKRVLTALRSAGITLARVRPKRAPRPAERPEPIKLRVEGNRVINPYPTDQVATIALDWSEGGKRGMSTPTVIIPAAGFIDMPDGTRLLFVLPGYATWRELMAELQRRGEFSIEPRLDAPLSGEDQQRQQMSRVPGVRIVKCDDDFEVQNTNAEAVRVLLAVYGEEGEVEAEHIDIKARSIYFLPERGFSITKVSVMAGSVTIERFKRLLFKRTRPKTFPDPSKPCPFCNGERCGHHGTEVQK